VNRNSKRGQGLPRPPWLYRVATLRVAVPTVRVRKITLFFDRF
jgi:hypothetical protein